jgi:glyoxylase-like metal-dependent hydrolase (beta-lactamase superfamily II)
MRAKLRDMRSVRTRRAGTEATLRRAPVPALPELHQIALPTPWDADGVQVYLIEGDPVTLIDSGLDHAPSLVALESALDQLGLSFEDIGRVILTHCHRDHMGAVQAIRNRGVDLEVCAHPEDAPMIEEYSIEREERLEDTNRLLLEYGVPDDLLRRQTSWIRRRMRRLPALCEPTRVDRLIRDRDRISFKDFELEVIHTPGHTAGHIVLHERECGVLLSGDHIIAPTVPSTENYYIEGAPDPRDQLGRRPRFKGLPEYLRSVRLLRGRSFKKILPAQGVTLGPPARLVEDSLLYYEVRVHRLERGLRKLAAMGKEVTGWELWTPLFPDVDPVTEMRVRMLMVIGALDVLEESGSCVTRRRDDGVLVHRHAGHRPRPETPGEA